jgi:hypothetical protein
MNTNFSSPGLDYGSNVYNPDWSNHSNFLWQAQAMGNCAPQYHDLHHPENLQFNHQSSPPSSYNYQAQELLISVECCTFKPLNLNMLILWYCYLFDFVLFYCF